LKVLLARAPFPKLLYPPKIKLLPQLLTIELAPTTSQFSYPGKAAP